MSRPTLTLAHWTGGDPVIDLVLGGYDVILSDRRVTLGVDYVDPRHSDDFRDAAVWADTGEPYDPTTPGGRRG